jgi:hypothetical protein
LLPEVRANSQATSAVRRFPICRSPVGLGANRPLAMGTFWCAFSLAVET